MTVSGVILAGGQSRRMRGVNKALLDLNGKPMLQHVLDRLRPQVDSVLLSVHRHTPEYQRFGCAQVEDCLPEHPGPLVALCSALRHCQRTNTRVSHLLMVPCDAPLLPTNLCQQLQRSSVDHAMSQPVVVVCQGQLQPTFSLWPVALADTLETAIHGQVRGFKALFQQLAFQPCHWPDDQGPAPFSNINRPEDVAQLLGELPSR